MGGCGGCGADPSAPARGKCERGRQGFLDCRLAHGRPQARLPRGKIRICRLFLSSLAGLPRRGGPMGAADPAAPAAAARSVHDREPRGCLRKVRRQGAPRVVDTRGPGLRPCCRCRLVLVVHGAHHDARSAQAHDERAPHLNPVGNSSVGSRFCLVAARLRNAQPATDPVSETVGELGMARHGLNRSSGRVEPQRVSSAFPLQHAAVPAQMPQQAAALHAARTSTTIVSRSASSGTPRNPSSRRSRSSRAMAC